MLLLYLAKTKRRVNKCFMGKYRLCDVVDDDCAVGVAIVHWRKRFVSLLACGIPYLEFDGC